MKKILILLFSGLLVSQPAWANKFEPKKEPVRVIIPFAPGGGTDAVFRHLQKYASERGINFVPMYKGGAEGLIGMSELAAAPTDGMTMAISTSGTVVTHKLKNPDYDFEYVSALRGSIFAVVTHADSGLATYADLERDLRQGSRRVFGQGAPGQKMALEQMFRAAGAKSQPTVVPYKGGGPVVNDVVGGHIAVTVVPMSIAKAHIDAGKLRLLAFISNDVSIEYGNAVNLVKRYSGWDNTDGFMVVLPRGTDAQAMTFWSNFIRAYLSDPLVRKDFIAEHTEIVPFGRRPAVERINNLLKLSK